MAFNLSRDII